MVFSFVRRNFPISLCLLAIACQGVPVAYGGQYTLIPKLTVVEELNDNIYETEGDRESDLITHIIPSINFNYAAKLWDWNIVYAPEYRYYAEGSRDNEWLQYVAGIGNIRLIDNFLFLKISDIYRQIPQDGYRDTPYANRQDENIFTISPYIQYQLNLRWMADTGYRYVNRNYSDSDSYSNQEHGAFLKLTRELTPKSSVFTKVDLSRVYYSDAPDNDRLTHTVGGKYQYAQGSSVSAEGGYSIAFLEEGDSEASPYWNVGLIHSMGAYRFNFISGVSYDSDPYYTNSERRHINARLAKEYNRGALGVSGGYYKTVDSITGTTDSEWFIAGADATYQLTPRATAHAEIFTDKYLNGSNRYNDSDKQFRNSFNVGIRYELYSDFFAGLDYNRIAYSDSAFSPSGPIEVNRLMISLSKSFTGFSFKND